MQDADERAPAAKLLLEQPEALASLLRVPAASAAATVELIAETAMAMRERSTTPLWPAVAPHTAVFVRFGRRPCTRPPRVWFSSTPPADATKG